MNQKTNLAHLDGKFLIAMPGMGDPRFERSVIYMCAHSPDGAMGLIINKPAPDLRFTDLLDQLGIDNSEASDGVSVYFGGPVEHGRGFVLHTLDREASEGTLTVTEDIGMTATLDILEDISLGDAPEASLLALGYAGWGPGQLEREIQENGWLTCDASLDVIFSVKDDQKWHAALGLLGIDPRLLSAEGGSA